MSFYGANDAIYGSGEYGTASYNVVTPIIVLGSVSATGTVNDFNPTISVTLSGVSATGLSGTVTAVNDSSLTLGSVVATGFVNTLSENPSEAVTGVSATGAVGTVFAQALFGANDAIYGTGRYGTAIYGSISPTVNLFSPTSLTGAVASVAFDGLEVDVSEVIPTGVSATVTLGLIRTIPFICQSVSATGAVGTVFLVTSAGVTGVSATGAIEQVQVDGFEIDVQERLQSVSATGVINGTITHSNTHRITSAIGTSTAGIITATGVTFNFIANDYDRKRVVYVPRQDTAAERRAAA